MQVDDLIKWEYVMNEEMYLFENNYICELVEFFKGNKALFKSGFIGLR